MTLSTAADSLHADPTQEPPIALVVDDDEDIREECIDGLRARGIPSIGATNADEAFTKLIANRSIHVLLTDIRMPRRSGFDLLEQVHLACANAYAVEAVIMSAYVGSILEQHPARDRASDLLMKPATTQEICSAVLKAAAKAASRRAKAAAAANR